LDIYIEDEQTYNNTYRANKLFNKSIFDKQHPSYYTQQDIDILDEYGTVPQLGVLRANLEKKKVSEIDICKAYTAAMKQIMKVSVFNEFDVFKPYEGSKIDNQTLYKVKATGRNPDLDLFLQKSENLVYGEFVKQLNEEDIEILHYKKPSVIAQANYAEAVDVLYATELYGEDYKEYLKGSS
jgi:hypothetical protein